MKNPADLENRSSDAMDTVLAPYKPEDTEAEPLTAAEARRLLSRSAKRRNGTRWSVGLAMGLRQNEALGLR
jgi:integrase